MGYLKKLRDAAGVCCCLLVVEEGPYTQATHLSVSSSARHTSVETYPCSTQTTAALRWRLRDSAQSTVDTGSRAAHTGAGRSSEAAGGDSFTAVCWDWSWEIKITDRTDMMADNTPRNDMTTRDRWLYPSDMLILPGSDSLGVCIL